MHAPVHLAVRTRRVVLSGQHGDVMAARLGAGQLARVDLRPRLMPRQKIVNRVKDAQRPDVRIESQ